MATATERAIKKDGARVLRRDQGGRLSGWDDEAFTDDVAGTGILLASAGLDGYRRMLDLETIVMAESSGIRRYGLVEQLRFQ